MYNKEFFANWLGVLIVLGLVLWSQHSIADTLVCTQNFPVSSGKYQQNYIGGLASFKTDDGRKIIFSFNNCEVILDKE